MAAADWLKVITASVVPVVIISACGLLCLAFYNRLAAIVSRVRAFQRERLHEQEKMGIGERAEPPEEERRRGILAHLEAQTLRVIRRARLIRRTLMFLLLAIALLIVTSLLLGLSVILPGALILGVPVLALGLLSMLAGIVTAMMELKSSLEPAELESRFVSSILQSNRTGQGIEDD